jgi:serine/threonine protein kinase
LSEFHEEEKIGEGGFGVVFRSTHLLSNQSFAVKKIRLTGTKKSEVDTLLREVRTLAKIGSHCNGE